MMTRTTRMILTVTDFISMGLGVGLFAFFLYLIPFALLDLRYSIPFFVAQVTTWLQDHYGMSEPLQMAIILIPLLLVAIIFFIISGLITSSLDRDREKAEDEGEVIRPYFQFPLRRPSQLSGTLKISKIHPVIKHLVLIVLMLILLGLAEYLIMG